MNLPDKSGRPEKRRTVPDVEIDQIVHSLEGLRFGEVQIIVHDGVIVQINRTEKQRLRQRDGAATDPS